MAYAHKVDANQAEIVQALRDIGANVAITSMVGSGFPDLVVGFRGENYLLEIKDGSKPPSKRKLTQDEQVFHTWWGGQVDVANSVEEAIRIVAG